MTTPPTYRELTEPDTAWSLSEDEDDVGSLLMEGSSWRPMRLTGRDQDGKWASEWVDPVDLTPDERRQYIQFLELVPDPND